MDWGSITASLGWAAFLGMLGQGVRSADGLNKLYQQGLMAKFAPGRLVLTLITGAIVSMALSLGHFVGWSDSGTYFLMGYVGADLIEKRAAAIT